jgi:hypothetical protein
MIRLANHRSDSLPASTRSRGRSAHVVAALVASSVLLLACGGGDDDDASGSGSEPAADAPEDLRASDADVATGLQEIDDLVDQVAGGVADDDDEAATEANEQIEPVWQEVEGTIKANDPDAYIEFEDNFALLGSAVDNGDADGAQTAADAVSGAVTAYLADHPG